MAYVYHFVETPNICNADSSVNAGGSCTIDGNCGDGTCDPGWVLVKQLLPDDPAANDGVGPSVAIAGDFVFVGAPK